jgi:hypothetical protein
MPKEKVPLEPKIISEEDCGAYIRRKVSIQVLAVTGAGLPTDPQEAAGRVPAIICFYGTTSGAGKDVTVGLSGPKPGDAASPQLVIRPRHGRSGLHRFTADYLRDGERLPPSGRPYHGMHWAVPKGASSSQSMPALRPYVLDPTLKIPATFAECTALVAPRPLTVSQAVGERRPLEEENHAAVAEVFRIQGATDRLRYLWFSGDHDFPPVARAAAVEWLQKWFRVR